MNTECLEKDAPDPIAKLFNLNLIIQAKSKAKLNYAIKDCIPSIKDIPYSNKIKWTIYIDPIDYD